MDGDPPILSGGWFDDALWIILVIGVLVFAFYPVWSSK